MIPFALPLLPLFVPILLALAVALLWRAGVLGPLAERPLLVAGAGIAFGVAARAVGLPDADPDLLREASRLGLAVLAFTAAQQARLSRLGASSPAAARLVLLGLPALVAATAGTVFAVLPGLGAWSAVLIGATVALGVGAFGDGELLGAPVAGPVKRAVRLDASMGLVAALPIALLVEAATIPLPPGGTLTDGALFAGFAGAAVGGAVGLLAGRLLPLGLREGRRGLGGAPPLPRGPLLALAFTLGATALLGFDGVMAALACGLLYSEEAGLSGRTRGRLFAAGRAWCAPAGVFVLGLTLGPVLGQADLLVWLAAGVPVLVLRVVVRGAVLGGSPLAPAERGFLAWFGGAPGAGAALFAVSLLGSPSEAAQALAITVAATAAFVGLAVGRLSAGPLVTRLVHATARGRRRRYGAA